MKKLIKHLSGLRAVSGFEYRINEEIARLFAPYADEVSTDTLGSVIAVKRSGKPNAVKVMLEAHCDEIGLMVKEIDERGFLGIVNVGGVDPRILPASEVIVHGSRDLKGVIGAKPPHLQSAGEAGKSAKMEDMAVDLGLPAEKVRTLVAVGDSITLVGECTGLLKGQLSGKSLDDRAGAAALLTVFKKLSGVELNADVYAVIATREEVGGFGAAAAAYSIEPDMAIALDVCHGITPDNSRDAYEVGCGVVITCGPNIHPKIFARLTETAARNKIKTEIDADGGNTGTDAWVIQTVRAGIPTGLLSIPLKYMHTTVETIAAADVKAAAELMTCFVKELEEGRDWLCL